MTDQDNDNLPMVFPSREERTRPNYGFCPRCRKPLNKKIGKDGKPFLGCAGYIQGCTYTRSLEENKKEG